MVEILDFNLILTELTLTETERLFEKKLNLNWLLFDFFAKAKFKHCRYVYHYHRHWH